MAAGHNSCGAVLSCAFLPRDEKAEHGVTTLVVRGGGGVLGMVNVVVVVEALGNGTGPHRECGGGAELGGTYTGSLLGSVLGGRLVSKGMNVLAGELLWKVHTQEFDSVLVREYLKTLR